MARFPITLQIIFATATISLVVWLPDAPRWLLSHHRNEEAIEVLSKLHQGHEDPKIVDQGRIETVAAITCEQQAQEKFLARLVLSSLHTINMSPLEGLIFMADISQCPPNGLRNPRTANILPNHAWRQCNDHATTNRDQTSHIRPRTSYPISLSTNV